MTDITHTLTGRVQNYIARQEGNFNELALAVFAYQFEYCEAYQAYCQQLNLTPKEVQRWQEIPAVSTEVFREYDLCTLPPSTAQYVFQTSGTTESTKGKHYYHDMTLYNAAIQSSFMSALNLPLHSKPLFRILTPSFVEVPTSSLFYMFQKIVDWYGDPQSRFYFNQNELNYEQLKNDLMDDIAEQRPIVLLGTAFSFVNFFDYLHEKNLSFILPKQSKLLETGGLKGRARQVPRTELYQLFFEKLGLGAKDCFSEYGMTELSSQCYSISNTHHFKSPHWMPVSIIHPSQGIEVVTGETGLVQFFDLANVTGISAILTSDLAIKQADGFELIGRAPKAVLRGCSTVFEKLILT